MGAGGIKSISPIFMAISKILYPLDLTGENSTNRIDGERHVIGISKYRAIALNYGP